MLVKYKYLYVWFCSSILAKAVYSTTTINSKQQPN